jgi:lysophospholipase L1-like esterase
MTFDQRLKSSYIQEETGLLLKMKTIVCHGDSLTEGPDLAKNDTWPVLVQKALNINVLNSGISGDTTGGLLSRFYSDVIRHRPDMVIIVGGTNDLWWDLSINVIQSNIFAMACQALYHGITPVIGLPLPVHVEAARRQDMLAPVCGYEACIKKMSELVKALSKSAEKTEVLCLDFYHAFFDRHGNVSEKYFFEDGLHPNKAGHRLMAETTILLLASMPNLAD